MHDRLSINKASFISETNAEFLECARTLGAQSVVLLSGDLLEDGAVEATRRMLGTYGPRVEAIHHRFGVYPDLARDEGMAAKSLMRVVEIGERLGVDSVYMTTGGRGGLDWETAAARFVDLIAPVAAAANDRGIRLLVETTSPLYVDRHIAHTLADTIELVELADIGICLELFYIWTERDLIGQFRRALPRCGMVQVSDYVLGDLAIPSRAVPGDGAVPLEAIIGGLIEAGYEGIFDIEIIGPRIDAEGHVIAMRRAVEHVTAILTANGL